MFSAKSCQNLHLSSSVTADLICCTVVLRSTGAKKEQAPTCMTVIQNVAYLFIYYCREAYITVQTILWQTYNTNVMIGTIISTLTTG